MEIFKLHKNERGDDVNITVAEKVSRTVRGSKAGRSGDIGTIDQSTNVHGNSIEYDCVRISPSFMEFKDACEGMTFSQLFIIQNMGKHAAHVRIGSPNSIAFQVKTLRGGVFLSPGLRILRWVHYSYKRTSVLHTMIPIYINRKYIDYHVICTLARADLSIEPTSLDFGLVDIGSTSGTKLLTLRNGGGKSTRFAIDLGPNEMDLSVKPMRGILQARSEIILRVELIGVEEGTFFGEFWIKSTPNMRVPVNVKIIIPRLVVHHPNTTGDFTLIDFPLTFVNTTKHDTIVLRSLSAQVSNFVVLGEIDNDLIPFKNINLKKHPAFQVFTIYPLEGRMDPFEGRVFNITFSPTVKVIKETEEFRRRDRQDFMVFIRIFRVHCTEIKDIVRKEVSLDDRADEPLKKVQLLEPDSAESLEISDIEPPESPGYETVRLCLYGETEAARLDFVPNALHFGNITIGEVSHRELTILNPSHSASVMFKFVPNIAAHCEPSAGRLEAQKSVQVLITVNGSHNVTIPFKLKFDALVRTCDLTSLKVLNMMAKSCCVLGWYTIIIPRAAEDKGKKSSGTLQLVQKKNRGGNLSIEADNLPKALVNKKLKDENNFLAQPRGLDCKYALSREEATFRFNQRLYWTNYLQSRRNEKESTALKHLTLISSKITDCKDLLTAKLPKIKEQSIAQKMSSKSWNFKVVNKARDETLVPLSPLQIYNVKIAPTVLAYGLVAPKSTNYRTLHIENLNDFPVMLNLFSRVSKAITFTNGSVIVLQPGSRISRIVEYRAQRIGKFNTYIDYVINNNHPFAMTVTATVVLKSLNLKLREITFGKKYLPLEAYQPLASNIEIKNKLDATISFTWDLRSNASFSIYPMSGEVKGNRSLFAEICYEPINLSHEVILISESGAWTNLKLNTILKKPDVAFINATLNLNKIPLNMTTTAIGVLHNAEFTEVMFQIDQSTLIYGCEVYPHRGIIPPRGIVNLEVRLRFDACFKFSINVNVMVQQSLTLDLKIIGQVSYPMLKISPEIISMKRISADTFATHFLNATNTGITVLKVQFPLEEYLEYHVSLSPRRSDPALGTEGVTLLPDTSVSIYLHFIPAELASYSFYLPIVINEILGPVLMESPKTNKPADFLKQRELCYANYPGIEISQLPPSMPTVFIDCTVSGHVISFSKHIFNFDAAANKMKDELRVSNKTHQEVSFIVRIDDFSEPKNPFSITWLSGVKPTITPLSIVCTLQHKEEILFLIVFKPVEQGTYEIEVPIFVRGELDGNMFNSLLITGTNVPNCIVCDKTELYFAPVALAVEAEQKLTIKVSRCQNPVEIKAVVIKPAKCVGPYSNDCIQAKFLGSNFITGKNSSEELEISIIFQSPFPVAFCTEIEFHVADVIVCITKVYVIADNCVLTTYGLLRDAAEADGIRKPLGRISFPSITSRGEDSSSLTKQELIAPRKGRDPVLKRFSMYHRMSGVSQKSLKFPLPDWKLDDNEDEKSEVYDDDDFEGVSLKSRASGSLPPILDQYLKSSRAVYPSFPLDNYMQRTLAAAEQWMYSGGFKFNFYPSIVDGITAVLSGVCLMTSRSTEKRRAHTVSQSFIDLLISLAGADVLRYIGDISRLPEEPVERVRYVLALYDNVLEFLAVQGAFLPHVKSKFLLSYNDYLLSDAQSESSRKVYSPPESGKSIQNDKMSKEMFQSRSKQCWLDLALQTFKNLVLKRISLKNIQNNITSSSNLTDSSNISSSVSSILSILDDVAKQSSVEENPQYITKYTNEETLLLSWLQHHFDQQRLDGWMQNDRAYLNPHEKRESLQSRTVSNFDSDLADSLVLIAVTAAHCPYLIDDYFRNIYIIPRNVEELHHNAVCLTSAWRRIRLGFLITPGQIIRSNCVQMLILVTHLFQILPTYLPSTKIAFCCPLTETITRQISFNNTTDFPVSYIVEFIANKMNLFTAVIPQMIVNLEARSVGSLKIRYHARKIAKTNVYVILCGSGIAPNFARNHVFILEGCTSFLGITNDYNIDRMLYQVCNEILNIPVPYKEAAEYDISVTEEQPTVPATLKISRWADLRTRKVPQRLFLNQNTVVVKENSNQADLSITITCIAPVKRSFWIIFESEIGDFIIQINSTSKKATTDYIAVEWDRETCTCSDISNGISSTCPLNIKIPIPARNVQLWNCVNEMFQKTLDSKECSFWSHHIDTNIGLRLIHWLMGDYHDLAAKEFMHIFNTSVTYDVAINDHGKLIFPTKFTIHDVRLRESHPNMMVHILETTPQNYAVTMNLSSPDGMEYRIYKIKFDCRAPIPPTVTTSETDNQIKKKNKRR